MPQCRAAARREARWLMKPAGKKNGPEECDALGRRRRAERRRIEALRAKMEPLAESKHHPVAALFPKMIRKIREQLRLSLNGAAELSGLSPLGVAKYEKSKGAGSNNSLGLLCRGYGWKMSRFVRRTERERDLGLLHEG